MDKGTLKAIVMALMSPMAIGGTLNDVSFKNLDTNAQRIIDHCVAKPDKKESYWLHV